MDSNNFERFMQLYTNELQNAVLTHPNEYQFDISSVPTVAAKMRTAFEQGTYNKDGRAIKAVCKFLGIKHTYSAIKEFMRG